MPEPYGSFGWICAHAPLPTCNILFAQAWWEGKHLDALFPPTSFYKSYNITSTTASSDAVALMARKAAGTGIGASCVIAKVMQRGSTGDVVLVAVSLVSLVLAAGLIWKSYSDKLTVGSAELSLVLVAFALHSILQALTQSSMLLQGSGVLLVLSSVHVAVIATMMWLSLCNILTLSEDYDQLVVTYKCAVVIGSIAIFGGTLYIALATGYGLTKAFLFNSPDFKSNPLFTITLVWPALALCATYGAMFYIAEYKMHEREPALWLFGSVVALAAGQAVLFIASQPLCEASNRIINGAFVAGLMNMVALVLYYRAWNLMSEASWSLTQHWMPRGQ